MVSYQTLQISTDTHKQEYKRYHHSQSSHMLDDIVHYKFDKPLD